ncbi:MAG: hypothetical protein E7163_01385 [Firmicutes bacterium]|nr:hypothetical protein [Bacillota bacterium]
MFGAPVNSGLTFTKVLGGISKTLNIANQVIPLYREAKPMINNAKTILSVLKDVNKPKQKQITNIKTEKKDTSTKTNTITTNSPSFFL